MSRIKLVEKDDATPEIAPLYNELEKSRGSVPNLFKAIAYSEKMLAPALGVADFVTTQSRVSILHKQLAYLIASRANNCEYCLERHARAAMKVGMSDAQVTALHQPGDLSQHPAFDERERLIIRYAEQLSNSPNTDPALFDVLRGTFDDEELAEITFVIAGANMFNRLVGGLGVELEASFKK